MASHLSPYHGVTLQQPGDSHLTERAIHAGRLAPWATGPGETMETAEDTVMALPVEEASAAEAPSARALALDAAPLTRCAAWPQLGRG